MLKTALIKILKDTKDVNEIMSDQKDIYTRYWSRGHWSKASNPNYQEIIQDVHKEYPLWTKTSLVGNI